MLQCIADDFGSPYISINPLITDQFTTVCCKWDLEELWQREALAWPLYPGRSFQFPAG